MLKKDKKLIQLIMNLICLLIIKKIAKIVLFEGQIATYCKIMINSQIILIWIRITLIKECVKSVSNNLKKRVQRTNV